MPTPTDTRSHAHAQTHAPAAPSARKPCSVVCCIRALHLASCTLHRLRCTRPTHSACYTGRCNIAAPRRRDLNKPLLARAHLIILRVARASHEVAIIISRCTDLPRHGEELQSGREPPEPPRVDPRMRCRCTQHARQQTVSGNKPFGHGAKHAADSVRCSTGGHAGCGVYNGTDHRQPCARATRDMPLYSKLCAARTHPQRSTAWPSRSPSASCRPRTKPTPARYAA